MRMTIETGARGCACALAALLSCGVALANPATPAMTLQQQRDAFRAAYAAARDGRDWRPLAEGLENYPLYPYLEGAALRNRISTADRTEIDAYLEHYTGSLPAEDLRKAVLGRLARQKHWVAFLHFYRPGLGDTLTCDALQARLAQGGRLGFERDVASLWQDTSLPSACAPVLDAAAAQGLLTSERVWDRIERAADAHHSAAVSQAAEWLSGDDAAAARRIALAVHSPATLLKQASRLADTPRNRDAISRALARLARRHTDEARAEWRKLSPQFKFDDAQRGRVMAALALYTAVDGEPGALDLLSALPPAAQTADTREWRVRLAVVQGDWKAAEAAIAALTPDEMQHDVWRYWQARVAQKLGKTATALDEYGELAQQSTFYGYLAADRANIPYSICPRTAALDASTIRELEANPGLSRAFEFFALDMLSAARREWHHTFAELPPGRQIQAAALATGKGWYDRAIFELGRSGDLEYFALRFPLADRDRVLKASHDAGIDPAWAFAIIRAESAWQPDARSGADARGLMQLLPSTAAHVARRSDLAYHGAASLYDPAINIPLGTQYLASLARRFDGSPWLASASYNAGPGNASKWVDARGDLDPERFILAIPFSETRAYVTRVLSFTTMYDWRLHGSAVPVSSRMPAIGTPYDPAADPVRKPVVCRASAAVAPAASSPVPAASTSP